MEKVSNNSFGANMNSVGSENKTSSLGQYLMEVSLGLPKRERMTTAEVVSIKNVSSWDVDAILKTVSKHFATGPDLKISKKISFKLNESYHLNAFAALNFPKSITISKLEGDVSLNAFEVTTPVEQITIKKVSGDYPVSLVVNNTALELRKIEVNVDLSESKVSSLVLGGVKNKATVTLPKQRLDNLTFNDAKSFVTYVNNIKNEKDPILLGSCGAYNVLGADQKNVNIVVQDTLFEINKEIKFEMGSVRGWTEKEKWDKLKVVANETQTEIKKLENIAHGIKNKNAKNEN